jgi:hypothetical protein
MKFSKWGVSLEGDLNNLLANVCHQLGSRRALNRDGQSLAKCARLMTFGDL